MAEDEIRPRPVGELLDRVRWDYDPEAELLSPLVSTQRYFRDFPWDGQEALPEEPVSQP